MRAIRNLSIFRGDLSLPGLNTEKGRSDKLPD